jgi:DNA-binding beta-propeller fold protein YncE
MVLLVGCRSSEVGLSFSMPQLDLKNTYIDAIWPAPPAQARYAYVGDLTGEQNYKNQATNTTSRGLTSLLKIVAGVESNTEPLTVLQRPLDISVDDKGRIFVTDISRQAIFVFDQSKDELILWEDIGNGRTFKSPIGIVSTDEYIFVADSELGEVFVLGKDGRPLRSFGKGLLKRPTGLAANDDEGYLYVADAAAHSILIFGFDGHFVRSFGQKGDGAGEFNAPTYLMYKNGNLYVTDTLNARVQVLNRSGEPMAQVGRRGLYVGNLTRPKGVGVDSEGNIYIVESYYDHLLIFDSTGNLLLPIGGPGHSAGSFFQPAGLFIDADDRIFVADMLNGRVAIFQYLHGEY